MSDPRISMAGLNFCYPGGHAWWDHATKEWVAMSYTQNLGRFKTKAEVVASIEANNVKTEEWIRVNGGWTDGPERLDEIWGTR